jgi:hypothetical protein
MLSSICVCVCVSVGGGGWGGGGGGGGGPRGHMCVLEQLNIFHSYSVHGECEYSHMEQMT